MSDLLAIGNAHVTVMRSGHKVVSIHIPGRQCMQGA